MTPLPWWEEVEGSAIAQGELLPAAVVVSLPADFVPPAAGDVASRVRVTAAEYDVIVATQSCDIPKGRTKFVVVCPVRSVSETERVYPTLSKPRAWEEVRRGLWNHLHLLPSPTSDQNRDCLVVNMSEIFSLPKAYVATHAQKVGRRWRLRSPYVEHFSQAFARSFMRVGLPDGTEIPKFE